MNLRVGTLLAAVLAALGCSNSAGPEWVSTQDLTFVEQAATAPLLEFYTLTFDACVGETSQQEINYASGEDFLQFDVKTGTIVRDAQGNPLSTGECVPITISVDSMRFIVKFQPEGLRFGEPAEVEIEYARADSIYLVQDSLIAPWRQEQGGDPWLRISPLRFDVDLDEVEFEIPGFTRYALAVN